MIALKNNNFYGPWSQTLFKLIKILCQENMIKRGMLQVEEPNKRFQVVLKLK